MVASLGGIDSVPLFLQTLIAGMETAVVFKESDSGVTSKAVEPGGVFILKPLKTLGFLGS